MDSRWIPKKQTLTVHTVLLFNTKKNNVNAINAKTSKVLTKVLDSLWLLNSLRNLTTVDVSLTRFRFTMTKKGMGEGIKIEYIYHNFATDKNWNSIPKW